MGEAMFKSVLQLIVLVHLLVLITASTLPYKDERCPASEGTNSRLVLLPHKNDCRKFYYCANGYLVEMECPPGLVFNSPIKVCDWPRNFRCNLPYHDSEEIQDIIWRANDI